MTDALLGPAQVRDLAGRLGSAADQGPRAELRGRPRHRAHGSSGSPVSTPGERVVEVGPGARLADPRPARGRCVRGRRRDRPGARRPAARHRAPSALPEAADAAHRGGAPTRCGSPSLPGPPPTALVANLPYNVAVPVLLTFLERFDSLERVLVMVQAEVADRLVAPPGLAHLRHPVGQGRLVRSTRARRASIGPCGVLAGAPGRLRARRPASGASRRRPGGPRAGRSRWSTPRSPSAARCSARRSPAWPARSARRERGAGGRRGRPDERGARPSVADFAAVRRALAEAGSHVAERVAPGERPGPVGVPEWGA